MISLGLISRLLSSSRSWKRYTTSDLAWKNSGLTTDSFCSVFIFLGGDHWLVTSLSRLFWEPEGKLSTDLDLLNLFLNYREPRAPWFQVEKEKSKRKLALVTRPVRSQWVQHILPSLPGPATRPNSCPESHGTTYTQPGMLSAAYYQWTIPVNSLTS